MPTPGLSSVREFDFGPYIRNGSHPELRGHIVVFFAAVHRAHFASDKLATFSGQVDRVWDAMEADRANYQVFCDTCLGFRPERVPVQQESRRALDVFLAHFGNVLGYWPDWDICDRVPRDVVDHIKRGSEGPCIDGD